MNKNIIHEYIMFVEVVLLVHILSGNHFVLVCL